MPWTSSHALGERQRHAARADPELECPAAGREPGEELDGRLELVGLEPLGGRLVVSRGDALVEVPVRPGHGSESTCASMAA